MCLTRRTISRAVTCLALCLQENAVLSISATSASLTQRCCSTSKTALVYLIGVHASSAIPAIAARTALSCRAVIEKAAFLPQGGGDHVVAVVGRVRSQYPHPGRTGGFGGAQRVRHEACCSLRAVGRALAPPGRGDHRRQDGVLTIASSAFRPLTPV